jgi:hypothetical protein
VRLPSSSYEQAALPQPLAEDRFDTGRELDTIALRPQSGGEV